jgi:pyruvate dehydrogenase E2 component (dihydrolipoamide acetyltransferase)
MADVSMPRLSDSMEEGTILKWLKSDGDEVSKGEELVEIETDKANMTYEADEEGTLEIVAQEGDTLPVGETIARIGEGSGGGKSDESKDEDEDEQPKAESDEDEDEGDEAEAKSEDEDEGEGDEEAEAKSEDEDDAEAKAEADEEGGGEDDAEAKADADEEGGGEREAGDAEAEDGDDAKAEGDENAGDDAKAEAEAGAAGRGGADGSAGNGRVKASPIARRMAREMGLELAGVRGTGPGGRIVKADVEAAARGSQQAEEAKPAPQKEEREPAQAQARDGDSGRGETTHRDLSRLQRTIARRMAESKATAPDFVISLEVDMEEAVALRKQLKAAAGDGPAPSFNDFVVKASARALRDFPRANGAYRDGAFELYSRVNVGVAVAGQDALVVPTIFDADKKGLGTIAAEARALAEKVRDGKITPPELSGGTFTVSNLGMYGIRSMVPVINPPQAAILGVGELSPRPAVRDGELVVRSLMELTLVCDHRILYGADAAEFLARIREYLETPLKLAL